MRLLLKMKFHQNSQWGMTLVKKKELLFLTLFLFASGQLAYDLTSPLGICDTVWYFIPLYLSIYVGGRYFSYLLAGIFSLLILAGFYLSPAGIDPRLALIGRLADISALWIMSLLISHHKAAMALMLRAKRALRAIGDCNHVLVRANTELALLQEISQVIVEKGSYRMAWVGFAENEEKSVRIAAHAGHNEGYLEQLQLTWADTEWGRGPTGTALRTGRISVVQNYQTDPTVAPWRAEATRRGYVSAIALPLRDGEKTFGALTLYASEISAFNSDEIELLTGLADNLAYGICALRIRQQNEQAEAALSKSEMKFRSLFQTMTEGVAIHELARDPEGRAVDYRILDVNPAYERHTGIAAAQAKGHLASQVYGVTPVPYLDVYEQAARTGVGCSFETYFAPLQRHFDISVCVPKPGFFATVFMDITQRKQSEAALSESRELLSLFMRHSPIYVYIKEVTSTESRVIQASDNFQQMIGISRLDMLGKTMSELFPPEFAAKMTADDRAVVAKGNVLKLDEDFNGRNYTTIKCPLVQGGKTLLAGYTIDITERKQLETEQKKLEIQNLQLQKSESLGRMAGAIAHHFNNQLQAVMMNLQLATQNLPCNTEPVGNLTEAMQSARKAAEVSSLMLTYIGQTNAKHEPMDLSEVCRRQLPMLQTAMPQSVVLEADFPSSVQAISANERQVQQVLTNLVTNAWEAMGDVGGAIRLAVKNVPVADIPRARRFPIDCKLQESAYACLEVADSASGIAAENIDKLFEPFFTSKFTGRGLGLAVVLGIARAHSGAVTVETQPGHGSVFRVFFPLSAEAIPQKSAHVAQVPKTANHGTVMVVDDDPPLRKAVSLALKRSGFTVFVAEDGVQALEVFQQRRDEIECVLCDLTMPRMSGWATLTALRKLSPGIPVILCSGYSEAQAMAGDHPELPQAFLSKPYDLAAICDLIVRVMRKTDRT